MTYATYWQGLQGYDAGCSQLQICARTFHVDALVQEHNLKSAH